MLTNTEISSHSQTCMTRLLVWYNSLNNVFKLKPELSVSFLLILKRHHPEIPPVHVHRIWKNNNNGFMAISQMAYGSIKPTHPGRQMCFLGWKSQWKSFSFHAVFMENPQQWGTQSHTGKWKRVEWLLTVSLELMNLQEKLQLSWRAFNLLCLNLMGVFNNINPLMYF